MLRAGRDDDAAAIIQLIGDCWAEYPGCVMDIDGENPDLRAFASFCAVRDGAAWVVDGAGGLAGMVGVKRVDALRWELCRMYVAASARGTGVADALMAAVLNFVRARGGHTVELWSDTRFTRAHRFYERHGFARDQATRALHDLSNTLEYGYARAV